MFVLTTTAKAVQETNEPYIGIALLLALIVSAVALIWVMAKSKKMQRKMTMSETKVYAILICFTVVLIDFILAGIKERKNRKDVEENRHDDES